MKKTNRNKRLTFFEANALAGDKAKGPPSKPSHGLEASTAPPPILILLPSQCYSSITTQLLAKLAEGSQPNLLTLPADGVISSRGDCTLCQQQEHVSLWPRPSEKPPEQKPMPSCWIWAAVLLQGYLHLPFSTRVPELGTNASFWAWWAQCAGVDLPHLQQGFFSELFDCIWISETKLHVPCWQRHSSLGRPLVINCSCAQKPPTSISPYRWVASSKDVFLWQRTPADRLYWRERGPTLYQDKTDFHGCVALDVGTSSDLWATETVQICVS